MIGRHLVQPADKVCPKHGEQMFFIPAGNVYTCQACGKELIEKDNQRLQAEYWERESVRLEEIRKNILYNSSITSSEIKNATLENYRVENQSQKDKLAIAYRIVDEYVNGAKNNVIFLGPPGVGKSHLAYGIIKLVSDKTKEHAMFIKFTELLSRIKADFRSSDNSEQKWIAKLSKVPFLVLDDLGTEPLSEWSKSVIFSILDNRNRTIITSNLGSADEIRNRYGAAIADRICKGVDKNHGFKFDDMRSQRRNYF